jgi:hypothetical protein
MPTPLTRRGLALASLGLLTALSITSCTPAGPQTFPVHGKLVAKNGDLKPFVGNMIEFRSESDPTIRSYGQIQPDGSFSLSTVYAAKSLKGAVAGVHKGRFPLDIDEDADGRPKKGKRSFDTKIARFELSGWEITVPVTQEIVLTIE